MINGTGYTKQKSGVLTCLSYVAASPFFFFKQMYCPIWISPMGNSGCFSLGKPAAVHAGCFSAATIHRTLTRTTGSFPCSQMLMHAIAQGGFTDTVRKSALKVDSGSKKKIPCRTRESNLRQRRASPTLYQLSYIPNIVVGCLTRETRALASRKKKKKVTDTAIVGFRPAVSET